MARWILEFAPESGEDLTRLDKEVRRRIIEKLDWLQVNFDQITPLPLGEKGAGIF